jgi:hypothetical protein
MAGASAAEDGGTIPTVARNKHTANPIHLFIVSLLHSAMSFAAKNAGNGLNTSFNATEDCGKLKQRFFNPALSLDLKLFDPNRHIMHHFNPILDLIYLPMNRLDDTNGLSRDNGDVATDRRHLKAHRIDQFLCFMGCPTELEKCRDQEDEEQNQACRNYGNTDSQ